MLCSAEGEYIANCEGDDFWTDRDKLLRQVNHLNLYPNYNICFHPSDVLNDTGEIKHLLLEYGNCGELEKVISCSDIILKGGGFMPMASIIIRRKVIADLIEKDSDFLKYNMTHFFYQIFGSDSRGALYLPRKMSTYRSMHQGSWSYKVERDVDLKIAAINKYIESVLKANKLTDYLYDKEFRLVIRQRIFNTLKQEFFPLSYKKKLYRENLIYLSIKEIIVWNIILRFRPVSFIFFKLKRLYNKCWF